VFENCFHLWKMRTGKISSQFTTMILVEPVSSKYRRFSAFVCSTFLQPAPSYVINSHPLISLSYTKFGLSYRAHEQTFRAITQWLSVSQRTLQSLRGRSNFIISVHAVVFICSFKQWCSFLSFCSRSSTYKRKLKPKVMNVKAVQLRLRQ
jgi:hypothetical protein